MRALTMALALSFAAAAGSANATVLYFDALLNGLNEAPPNASPGTGYGFVAIDDVANTMLVQVTFQEPGTYVLRAVASDGSLFTYDNVTVSVTQ